MRSHTPARCQSRRRRQHVIPEPHSSSCGSICQGMPLRRTNKMPVRHARSEMRGRPPLGRRGVVGKNGSTRSHNGSGSSAAAIPVHATSPARIRFRMFCYVLLGTSSSVFLGVRQSRSHVTRETSDLRQFRSRMLSSEPSDIGLVRQHGASSQSDYPRVQRSPEPLRLCRSPLPL